MVDSAVLTRRFEQIDAHLAKITPYIMVPYDDFLNNAVAQHFFFRPIPRSR